MKVTKHRQHHTETRHFLAFVWTNDPGAGFGFECDDQGNVDEPSMNPSSLANYRNCIDGTFDVRRTGFTSQEHSWIEPAEGICCCGRTVVLDGFTCPCECGRDYNSSGQLLAPRSQWGEETGEHLVDILAIP